MAEFDERLSTPGRRSSIRLPRVRVDSEAFGRFAEWIAHYMGSPQFLMWMTLFIAVWIIFNRFAPEALRFDDPQSFILLTLMLSIEAAYSAPLILLAQNRQEARDRLSFDEDRRIAAQSRADTDFLAREIAALRSNVGELATRDFVRAEIRDQLRDLLVELDAQAAEKENRAEG